MEISGQRAAALLPNPSRPAGARFIQACRSRNFTLAGTLFQAEAARQLSQLASSSLSGVRVIAAEDLIQAGRGGSLGGLRAVTHL